tara:strand:+ start:4260 stop:5255 length:996 start_codon:yes stop_codon:yes gene_type:complete
MILLSFGTRPEWIKIKPLIEEMENKIPYKLLFTGQHEDLLSQVKNNENLLKLKIKDGSNRLDSIVSSIMNCEKIFENIDYVLVQGDTTSAFSIALAAFHRRIKVIHLEAGLRTYDKNQPYPEEFNRQAISRIADIHLCPTESSKQFLLEEKVQGSKYVVGNTVLDNLNNIETKFTNKVIVTMHRRENHLLMSQWFLEINNLAIKNPDLNFILPLHPNPNVKKHKDILANIDVVDPLKYEDFLSLLSESKFVITDSGGLQEEASFFGKKCIVCREKTERIEGINTFSYICKEPSKLESIFNHVNSNYIPGGTCPYGDGQASKKIVRILSSEL